MNLKLGQKLKRKSDGREFVVNLLCEGGAMVDYGWITNNEIKEIFLLPKERWVPKVGDEYWYIEDNGSVDWGDNIFQSMCAFGNVFRTKEEAESARDRVKELLNNL